MKNDELIDFGSDALYNGRDYTFANTKITKEQRDFANYLFSEQRKESIKDPEKLKEVNPEDIAAYKESKKQTSETATQKTTEKAKTKPNEKPEKSQK